MTVKFKHLNNREIRIKETLLICDVTPALNENVGSEKRFPYYHHIL